MDTLRPFLGFFLGKMPPEKQNKQLYSDTGGNRATSQSITCSPTSQSPSSNHLILITQDLVTWLHSAQINCDLN